MENKPDTLEEEFVKSLKLPTYQQLAEKFNTMKYHRHLLAKLKSGLYQILCANCNQIKEHIERRKRWLHL